MVRKILLACLLAFLLLLLFSQLARASATKSYSADRFNVSAAIVNGGTMDVREQVTFYFTGGPFTFVSRQLPTDNTDGISVISVSQDDQKMSEGRSPGQYEVKSGNPISITWHFPPTSDSSHTFTLNYRIQGIIQRSSTDATDLLDWKPLPTNHDYRISTSVVTITYPSSTALVSAPEVAQGRATVSQGEGQVQFQSTDLAANASLEIGLRFRSGSLISTAPNWQQAQQQAGFLLPYLLTGGILVSIVGSFFFIRHYRRYRRSASVDVPTPAQVTSPPTDLPPAIAGVLAMTTDGSPTWDHALGTLFDLINRDIVAVIPPLQGGWSAWSNGRPDFQLALVNFPEDLRPHEAGLLNMLFRTEGGVLQAVKISEVGPLYNRQPKVFSRPLKQEMMELGFFEPWRQRIRYRLGCTTSVLCLLSLFTVVALLCTAPWPLIFLPLGVTGISITTFFLWATFSTYTDTAMQIKVQWEAFLNFMRSLTNVDQPSIGPVLFAQYLPYSASFSLLIPWAKTLQRQGMLALPNWFKRLVTADQNYPNDPTFAFLGLVETTHKHTHKSESQSGGGGSHVSGSSGAAGGGSSGAG